MIMSRLADAVEAGKHVKLINMLRFSNMTQHEILKTLGLLKLSNVQISSLITFGLEAGMKERNKAIDEALAKERQEDEPTFQASFHDLILDDGSITVGDIYPQMKRTKFKSKYSNI